MYMARRSSFLGRKKFQFRLKQSTVFSIAAVLLFALSGLTWVSFIHQGSLLIAVNDFLAGQLGWVATLFLPLPMLTGGLLITKIKSPISQAHVFVGSIIVLASIVGLFRGGDIGSYVWINSASLLSGPGAFVFLAAGLGVGLLVTFNIPFEDVAKSLIKTTSAVTKLPAKMTKIPAGLDKPIKISGLTGDSGQSPAKQKEIKSTGMFPGKAPTPTKPSPGQTQMSLTPSAATDSVWHYPPMSLLSENISGKADRGNVKENADVIEKTLDAFGITAKVVEINYGPAVTQYALEVAIGTKLSKISALSNDLALALAAPNGQIRIEAPIPGRSLVGIELPNRTPEFVSLRKILESDGMKHHKSKLAVALGLDVSGSAMVADIGRMPHVLIAGSTGSGKSVCINAFIGSLLYRCSPQELNLIMVDPKRVELTGYNGIPHLLTPVIVEPDKVLSALKWAVGEMDRRYKQFAEVGVRNLEGYNELSGFQALPYIVIFIDELADIMLYAQVEVEDTITRIAQMARATGIHLVLATQRPSVDIITGLIKANIPTRISFVVSSMIDSKVILDQPGAEKLLGRGDMLYVPPDAAKPVRIQGAFVSDREIHQLIDFLKKQGVAPHYTEEVLTQPISSRKGGKGAAFISPNGEARDELFADALRIIVQNNNASASFLQRKLSIGYARAAKILDEMYSAGAIGAANGAKPRDILISNVDTFLSPPKE
jgi:DNA segregation ATPase FtsK/SpoIIIE, S-DNA-T family